MKKFLWVFFLVVFLGIWFLLLIKNPQSSISQKVLPLLGYKNILYWTTALADPASVYCKQNSGTIEIKNNLSGWQSKICHLPNGTTCDEWSYFNGTCPVTAPTTLNFDPLKISFSYRSQNTPCKFIQSGDTLNIYNSWGLMDITIRAFDKWIGENIQQAMAKYILKDTKPTKTCAITGFLGINPLYSYAKFIFNDPTWSMGDKATPIPEPCNTYGPVGAVYYFVGLLNSDKFYRIAEGNGDWSSDICYVIFKNMKIKP